MKIFIQIHSLIFFKIFDTPLQTCGRAVNGNQSLGRIRLYCGSFV